MVFTCGADGLFAFKGGVSLNRLYGAALESCFKTWVLAKRRKRVATFPKSFRFKFGALRFKDVWDPDITKPMWNLMEPAFTYLASVGVEVKFAQSTFKRKDGEAGSESLGSAFSVDLMMWHAGLWFWVECKFTAASSLGPCLAVAESKLEVFRVAVAEKENWALDSHLGGTALEAPSGGFGTLLMCMSGWQLRLGGDFFQSPGAAQELPTSTAATRCRRSENKRKQRTAEKRQNTVKCVRQGVVLKKPASALRTRSRFFMRRGADAQLRRVCFIRGQRDRQTCRQIYTQPDRQADRQTRRQTDRQTNRQTDRQTYR